MIRLTALYPATASARFDHDYYCTAHVKLVTDRFGPELQRIEIDRPVAAPGGGPAPYAAAGHLYFDSMASFERAFAAHGQEVLADIPNYTDIAPSIFLSEIEVCAESTAARPVEVRIG